MAERKFDYENVSNIYRDIKNIIGESNNPESIAGILNDVNKEVENKVEVMDEAVFGDLGKQLQLDWDNTSSSFNDFVNNFNNWAVLITQSAGKYAEFEEKVNGLKISNPLGMTSNGLTTAYTNTGYYSDYTNEITEYLSSLSGTMMTLTGAQYIDTEMVEREKNRKIMAGVNFGLQAVSTVLSVVGGAGIVGAEAQAGKTILGGTSAALTTTTPALTSGSTLALTEQSGAKAASTAATQWSMLDDAGNVIASGPGVTNAAKGAAGVADDVASAAGKTIEMQATEVGGKTVYSAVVPKATVGSKITGAAKNVGSAIANSKVGQAAASKFSGAYSAVKSNLGSVGNAIKNGTFTAGQTISNGVATAGSKLAGVAGSHPGVVAGAGMAVAAADQIITSSYDQ